MPLVLLTYPEARPPENPYTRTEYYHYIFGNRPIGEDGQGRRRAAPSPSGPVAERAPSVRTMGAGTT